MEHPQDSLRIFEAKREKPNEWTAPVRSGRNFLARKCSCSEKEVPVGEEKVAKHVRDFVCYTAPMFQTLHILLNPVIIIQSVGLVGVLLIVFAESGLFFGFFFPGDSLLFTAGFLASQGLMSPAGLFIGAFIAAVLGDSVGYAFGRKIGPKIFTKEDSFFFNKKHIARSEHFYEKFGKKTIILARFVPIVRTFAPILAGVGNMKYRVFLSYNIIGGLLWSVGVSALGYFLGATVPHADKYVTPLVILIIIVSIIPPAMEYIRSRREQ